MQELPSCPLEETLQSIMEIDSVCVSNLETTANRNPTRRDTINHNRRDVSVCSERSRSPAVFSVKCHCIIIKAWACWVFMLLQSQCAVSENGLTSHCCEAWLEPCIVLSINCRSGSELCAIRGVCIENSTVSAPSQPICSRKSKITPLKKLLEWAETSGSCSASQQSRCCGFPLFAVASIRTQCVHSVYFNYYFNLKRHEWENLLIKNWIVLGTLIIDTV